MVALGLGVYSYLAALLTMPMYFVFTCAALFVKRRPRRTYALAAVAFAVPLMPLAVWQFLHPERYSELLAAYHLLDATSSQHLEGVRRLGGASSVSGRFETYWNFFNPGFLFFSGDSPCSSFTGTCPFTMSPRSASQPNSASTFWQNHFS